MPNSSSEAGSTARSPFGALMRATSPVSSGEFTPGRVAKKIRHSERSEESHRRTDGYIFLALVVGYFAHAQYDEICFTVFASRRRGNLPGGWRSTEYMPRTFSVGYFAYAQYDVLFLIVFARE